ncbi:hypothetical protein ACHAWO_007061 [Cyclotella atomus]|uniref:BZIP domain-containing protein n=1 Tax=Cyclotella atomus TaxID=382360 RepID=A0ABD3NY23_9STRA
MADTQPAPIVNEEVLKSPPEEEPLSGASDEGDDTSEPKAKRSKKTNAPVKTREMRLEQNRKAARESRKRKKVLVEELQRSVIFFSRTNGTLRSQNEEMEQLLLQAQAQLQAMGGQPPSAAGGPTPNLASVISSPWAMMGQQGFPPQVGVPAPQAQRQEKTQAPTPQGEGQQQPQQPQLDNYMLANWMNLAAMGGHGMMPFMGGGMMPFGFPFMAMPGSQGGQQPGGSVNNPLNLANSPSLQQQNGPSNTV